MMRNALLLLCLLCVPAWAKVSTEQAARLRDGGNLTPLGGERAGNKEGTIPEWKGGFVTPPAAWKGPGTRSVDPFPEDKPLFTITAKNSAQYKDHLTAGQLALLTKYPDDYKMNVFVTRRTAGAPKFVYEATYNNAIKATLGGNGEALVDAIIGIPFPIPGSGNEAIWNHKVRYRGQGGRRINVQAAVSTGGDYNLVKLQEDFKLKYSAPDATPETLNNVLIYFLQIVQAPPRLAGTITLVHETMDQVREPRRAWQYNPGQRRLRRAPNVGYDNPGTGADGLRTNDQTDTYNGATDRYTWKLVGKREMYVPYNAYRLGSADVKYTDILKPAHINQDLPRYELHRVWQIDADLKPTTSHIYKKRVFYLDEDSWQIVAVDLYDKRDQLWRVQESHPIAVYDPGQVTKEASGALGTVLETVYDLSSNRYLAMAMNNQEAVTYETIWPESYFDPANVAKLTTK